MHLPHAVSSCVTCLTCSFLTGVEGGGKKEQVAREMVKDMAKYLYHADKENVSYMLNLSLLLYIHNTPNLSLLLPKPVHCTPF